MCVRTYLEEFCTKCKTKIEPSTCAIDECWWNTVSRGRCQTETMAFKKIMVVGCKDCRGEEFEYMYDECLADQKADAWADDDPDNPPKPKPKYFWKNSLPEPYVRRLMGDEEYEKWKAEYEKEMKEKTEEEKRKKQRRRGRWTIEVEEEQQEDEDMYD